MFPNDSALENIQDECFRESGIESFVAPPSLKRTGAYAFSGCKHLKRVVLNEGLEALNGLLKGSVVEVVELPSTLRKLQRREFQNCVSLKSVRLPMGLEEIEDRCFWGSGIEEVTFSSTVEKIGKLAFEACPYLSAIWLEDDCLVDVKNSVSDLVAVLRTDTMVGNELLREFRKQKDVVIPDGVETIGERWFMNSKIQSVTIPASVQRIEREAFRGCK